MSSAETSPLQREPLLVLFAEEDEAFARGYLAPALGALGDGQPAARLLGGADLRSRPMTELEAELTAHRLVLLVLTPAFFADPWARVGEQLASFGAVGGERRVIPLRLAPCELPLRLDATAGLELAAEEGETEDERWLRWDEAMQRLRQTLALAAPRPPTLACPYPGLRPYATAEAAVYFGRATEIEELVSVLGDGARELFLIGPSGSGKSSLLAAGLLPRLSERTAAQARRLVVRQLRPGAHPTAALLAALSPGGKPGAGSALEVEAAAAALAGADTDVLVVIDQLEEAFAQASPAELRTFAAAVRALRALRPATATGATGSLALLYALRADFFSELLQSQLWAESSQRQHNLAPLSGAALRAALEQPALARGVYFEAGLLELLLQDAAEAPGALPLLQETLVQLWDRRRQRLLALAAYRSLGQGGRSGLVTALAQHADRILAALAPTRQALAKRLLVRLVAFGDGRPHTRRRQRRRELASSGDPGELGAVLDALARARLLILDSGADGADPDDDAVDLCHDALVTAWPQLAGWIAARQADEERRRRLEAAAHEWVESGRGSAGLLDRTRHAAAAAWLESEGAKEIGCSEDAAALVEASRRALEASARRRQRRLVATLVAVAFAAAVAIVLATLATLANRRAEASQALAEANERRARDEAQHRAQEAQRANRLLGEQYLAEAKELLEEGRPHHAIPYLVAAREVGYDSPGLRSAYARATLSTTVAAFAGKVDRLGLSADGAVALAQRLQATTPGSEPAPPGRVALWQPRLHGPPVELPLVGVTRALLSADGSRVIAMLATAAPRGTPASWLSLWDVSVRPPRELPLVQGRPHGLPSFRLLQFSADGAVLLGQVSGGLQLWDARTGAALGPVFDEVAVSRARLDATGQRLALATARGCVTVWTTSPRAEVARTCGLGISDFSFPSDRPELVMLPQYTSRALLWRYTEGPPVELEHHRPSALKLAGNLATERAPMLDAMAAGAGRTLITANETLLWRWDLDHPEDHPRPLSHRCNPHSLRVDRVHDRAIMACGERGALVWHLGSGALLTAVTPPYPVVAVELSADGNTLATLGEAGEVHLWELSGARGPALLALPPWSLPMLSHDGRRLAVAARNSLQLHEVDQGAVATLDLPDSGGHSLEFSPDGTYLLASSRKRGLRVWHVAERRLLWHRAEGRWEAPNQLMAWGPGGTVAVPLPTQSDGRERVVVFALSTGQQLGAPVLFEDKLHALAFAAGGRTLLVAGTSGLVRRYQLPDGQSQVLLDVRGDATLAPWSHVNLAAEGAYLAATKAGVLRLWDLSLPGQAKVLGRAAGERVFFCERAACVLSSMTESATASSDPKLSSFQAGGPERLRLWALPSGDERALPSQSLVVDVELHRGERALELSDTRRAQVRELPTGDPQSGELALPAEIYFARFSMNGERVMLVSKNGQVAVWTIPFDDTSLEAWQQLGERNAVPPLSRPRPRPGLRVPAEP